MVALPELDKTSGREEVIVYRLLASDKNRNGIAIGYM